MRLLLILAPIWFLVAWFVPESVFVRDSPEFVISAFFLDVAHPPGAPFYSQLANLFGLIPIGPIAWRISIFAALGGLVSLFLAGCITKYILESYLKLESRQAGVFGLVVGLIILSCPAFIRQSYTPEVYILNAILIEISILIFLRFKFELDRRFLYLGAFVSGLALGNHVSYVFVLLISIVIALTYVWRDYRAIIFSGCFVLLGLAVYGYLPARALTNPPLNTGMTVTIERLWAQMSDRRDFELSKPSSVSHEIEIKGGQKKVSLLISSSIFLESAVSFVRRLSGEIPILVLIFAALGLIILVYTDWRLGLLLIGIAFSNLAFFFGWSADPWIPLLICSAIGGSVTFAKMSRLLKSNLWPNILATSCVVFGLFQSDVATNLTWLRNFDFSRMHSKALVSQVPAESVFLTEPSWYLVAYLKYIERYRDDLNLAYVPDIYFPEHFRPMTVSNTNQETYIDSSVDDYHQKLGQFLRFALKSSPVYLEPEVTINTYLEDGLLFLGDGQISIADGKKKNLQSQYLVTRLRSAGQCLNYLLVSPVFVRDEVLFLCEVGLISQSDALSAAGFNSEAASLIEAMCLAPQANICSSLVYNNVAVYKLRIRDLDAAAKWLAYGIARKAGHVAILRQNLNEVLRQLGADQIQELSKDLVVSKIISNKADI